MDNNGELGYVMDNTMQALQTGIDRVSQNSEDSLTFHWHAYGKDIDDGGSADSYDSQSLVARFEKKINSLEKFFSHSTNLNFVSNLIKELNVTDFKTSKSGIFYGKTIMFTGGLSEMSRAEAKALVEKEGGKILGTTSKKLDYLVVGDSKPTSKKVERAKQLNIKILDENSWYGLLNR